MSKLKKQFNKYELALMDWFQFNGIKYIVYKENKKRIYAGFDTSLSVDFYLVDYKCYVKIILKHLINDCGYRYRISRARKLEDIRLITHQDIKNENFSKSLGIF